MEKFHPKELFIPKIYFVSLPHPIDTTYSRLDIEITFIRKHGKQKKKGYIEPSGIMLYS
jgi:hypothetical protein